MSQTKFALKISNLNKTFKIREKSKRSIKDSILKFYQRRGEMRNIEALSDVNFEVNKGEFFGIIGRNGSGKSTLLRLIMGSFKSDKGSLIESQGRIIRLAMGLGFDMNLSARDNIYVNASVLGLSFKKIGMIFHEILEFAELKEFIDTPIKHFSSGMVAKLKFSIAKYAEADILLMDEIFGGVGDISFQYKSQKVFKEKLIAGKTIVLVSHNLNIISAYCNRVLLLDKGKQIAVGPPKEIIPIYESLFEEELKERNSEIKKRQEERILYRVKLREQRLIVKAKQIQKLKDERKIQIEHAKQKRIEERNIRIEKLKKQKQKEIKLKQEKWELEQKEKRKLIEKQKEERIKFQKQQKQVIQELKNRIKELEAELKIKHSKNE